MAKAALRRIDAEDFVETPSSRIVPALVDGVQAAAPAPSAARELQQRLNYEFSGSAQRYAEPVVEKFSPGVSMMIVLGGTVMLWSALAVGVRLALH